MLHVRGGKLSGSNIKYSRRKSIMNTSIRGLKYTMSTHIEPSLLLILASLLQ